MLGVCFMHESLKKETKLQNTRYTEKTMGLNENSLKVLITVLNNDV
jgi:hypothetical protein